MNMLPKMDVVLGRRGRIGNAMWAARDEDKKEEEAE